MPLTSRAAPTRNDLSCFLCGDGYAPGVGEQRAGAQNPLALSLSFSWNSPMTVLFPRLLILFGMIFLSGCGSSESPLAPVSGTVYFNDAPLTSGTIVFVPDASRGASGPLAHAQIQSDGRFQLHSEGKLVRFPGGIV